MVSLSGAGGVGKSALLAEAVATVQERAHVWAVDLTEAPPASRLLDEIARTLGIVIGGSESSPAGTTPRGLATLIGVGPRVLVVDHADSCTVDDSLFELLSLCSELTLIVASTLPLRAPSERIALQALPVPAIGASPTEIRSSPAARLFAERARDADAQFRMDDETARSVADICRQLGGLPLAIELAAARARLLSPRELARRLTEDASSAVTLDILRPPADGAATVGIREALAANRAMLSSSQDELFLALSTFRGPFPLEAAVRITARRLFETLDDLDALVELRLVEPMPDEPHESTFRMLPIARAFGRESAGDSTRAEERRRAYLGELVREAAEAVASATTSQTIDHARTLRADVAEHVTFLAATDLEDAAGFAIDAAAVVAEFTQGSTVGEVLEKVIDSGTVDRLDARTQAAVWLWSANALARSADGSAQRELVTTRWQRGIAMVDDGRWPRLGLQGRLIALGNMAIIGDPSITGQAAREGRAIARAIAASAWLARFEVWEAIVAYAKGDIERAVAFAVRGMERGQRIDDEHSIAGATGLLRTLPAGSVSQDVPVPTLERALALARAHHDVTTETFLLAVLTREALVNGTPSEAARWCVQRLELSTRRGWTTLINLSLLHAALIAGLVGDEAFAARMIGAVHADEEHLLRSMVPATQQFYARVLGDLRANLGSAAFSRLLADGGILSSVDAATEAIGWLRANVASSTRPPPEPRRPISSREGEVLALLAAGLTNKEIATRLSVSAKTVMHHSMAIYRKLGVRGRTEATALAIRRGLLDRARLPAPSADGAGSAGE